MPIRVELCHVDGERAVVRASEWRNGEEFSSALGQAASAEEAEDRARQRLQRDQDTANTVTAPLQVGKPEPAPAAVPAAAPVKRAAKPDSAPPEATAEAVLPEPVASAPPSEAPTDPEDWSEELAAIDLEVRRLGWDRELERVYLERAFGHGSRHRLTRYSDLVAYLRQLKGLPAGAQPDSAPVPIRRSDLLEQGNRMLEQLGWSSDQARDFLSQQLNANSRQHLSDEQLLQFNMLLEEQTLKVS